MAILLIAEHDNATISDQTAKALSAALQIGSDVYALVAGRGAKGAADAAARLKGVSKVLLAEADELTERLAEPLAALVVGIAGAYDTIIALATSSGKTVAPRVAALLDVAQVSETIEVISPNTFKRPIYAGNAIQTVQSTDAKKVITASFPSASQGNAAAVENISAAADPGLSIFIENKLSETDRPELTSAKIGTRAGLLEKFQEVILPVADKLGAAVGASLAAVDAGYAPNDWQVGQTGKVAAPDLYIAVGISGDHPAPCRHGGFEVAINKDEEAPIFQVANYGLVGDLFVILPEISRSI
ncbi:electron transfer flavoprotein subunit alpha [Mesorhizobium tianshanense]|uniref:Electron transfer flavoprotein alpha subunit apoprotein n=1 Tax=Mesorhizobium tianshanense TaxID=39844 RepID=A0A562MI35_9HYPH|nr:FAD-binding protein [Mesorhizobium tianshanense]TWI19559.1 electron transfer flavoprotein alpha subunit apoprotein [Mesorhizobium tianshanense]GLS36910.1 electron transfer flavoprotein subunit alpha [Mesorhizobium tianshanense]